MGWNVGRESYSEEMRQHLDKLVRSTDYLYPDSAAIGRLPAENIVVRRLALSVGENVP